MTSRRPGPEVVGDLYFQTKEGDRGGVLLGFGARVVLELIAGAVGLAEGELKLEGVPVVPDQVLVFLVVKSN